MVCTIDNSGVTSYVLCTLIDGYELQFEKLNVLLEKDDGEFDAENHLFAIGYVSNWRKWFSGVKNPFNGFVNPHFLK